MDATNLDEAIEATARELARLRRDKRKAKSADPEPPPPPPQLNEQLIIGAGPIGVELEKQVGGKWPAARVQQDYLRGKFPDDVVFKYGKHNLASTPPRIGRFLDLLVAAETARKAQAAKKAAEQAAKKAAEQVSKTTTDT
jgi:hypothetical protein